MSFFDSNRLLEREWLHENQTKLQIFGSMAVGGLCFCLLAWLGGSGLPALQTQRDELNRDTAKVSLQNEETLSGYMDFERMKNQQVVLEILSREAVAHTLQPTGRQEFLQTIMGFGKQAGLTDIRGFFNNTPDSVPGPLHLTIEVKGRREAIRKFVQALKASPKALQMETATLIPTTPDGKVLQGQILCSVVSCQDLAGG